MSDMLEVKRLIEAQGTAWEEFKKTNDARIKAIESGNTALAADFEARLAKQNDELNLCGTELKALTLAMQRPRTGTADKEASELQLKSFNNVMRAYAIQNGRGFSDLTGEEYDSYKSALSSYIRRGSDRNEQMTDVERKTINVGTDPQGGYLTTFEMEAGIDRVVRRFSAMRQLARVISIGQSSYKKLVKVSGTSGGTRGNETTAPTNGTSPTWSELEFRPGTYTSEQRITSEALEDAVQNVEADLTEEMGIEFSEMEGQDVIDGTGVNGPRGLLSYTMAQNASYSWGSVGFIVTGGASGFAASNPSDALIDLQHALKRQYRAGASWVMNDATLGAIRKFKDGQGLYLWAPSELMQGAVGQLLGYPVVTDDFMPDLGSNTFPIVFGDFNRGYYIVDRKGVSIMRDPYTNFPSVTFKARRRVGGGIANFEAIKALKCST